MTSKSYEKLCQILDTVSPSINDLYEKLYGNPSIYDCQKINSRILLNKHVNKIFDFEKKNIDKLILYHALPNKMIFINLALKVLYMICCKTIFLNISAHKYITKKTN